MVVSSELDEVIGLADRIAVMYRGRIIGIVGPDTPREEIGLLMAGISPDVAHERSADAAPADGAATDGSPASDAGSANEDEAERASASEQRFRPLVPHGVRSEAE